MGMIQHYAIFDMDGTLVDSMGYWRRLAVEYLHRHGIQEIPPEVLRRMQPMTLAQSAALFSDVFQLPDTPEEILAGMRDMMAEHYSRDVTLKDGITDYLDHLHRRGVAMCVASATDRPLMELCLRRLGILERFSFLLSCAEVGCSKDRPDIYHAAAARLGGQPWETVVYEDAPYAIRTAKAAGYGVVAIYDDGLEPSRWEAVRPLADLCIDHWSQAIKYFQD